MTASEFWKWLNEYAPAITVVFAVIGAIWILKKHLKSKPGEHKPPHTNEPVPPSPEPLSYMESAPPFRPFFPPSVMQTLDQIWEFVNENPAVLRPERRELMRAF